MQERVASCSRVLRAATEVALRWAWYKNAHPNESFEYGVLAPMVVPECRTWALECVLIDAYGVSELRGEEGRVCGWGGWGMVGGAVKGRTTKEKELFSKL